MDEATLFRAYRRAGENARPSRPSRRSERERLAENERVQRAIVTEDRERRARLAQAIDELRRTATVKGAAR